MALDTTYSTVRRRNVSPTSSILHMVTRDMDCSGTGFLQPPEDGQFVSCKADTAYNPDTAVFHGASMDAVDSSGANLKMVWSSPLHSDRAALGDKRVPVLFQGDIEVECKLFNADAAVRLSTQYAPGTLVSVGASKNSVALKPGSAISDSTHRLVLEPMANNEDGWAVGYVTDVTEAGLLPVAGDSIKVMLYSQPRRVTLHT